jgi:hypothetical protein
MQRGERCAERPRGRIADGEASGRARSPLAACRADQGSRVTGQGGSRRLAVSRLPARSGCSVATTRSVRRACGRRQLDRDLRDRVRRSRLRQRLRSWPGHESLVWPVVRSALEWAARRPSTRHRRMSFCFRSTVGTCVDRAQTRDSLRCGRARRVCRGVRARRYLAHPSHDGDGSRSRRVARHVSPLGARRRGTAATPLRAGGGTCRLIGCNGLIGLDG